MYSPAELRIIKHFGYSTLSDRVEPLMMYRMMIEVAFETNDVSAYAKALRTGWLMFKAGKPARQTPTFERKLTKILDA